MLKKLAIFSLLVSTTGMAMSMPKNLEIKGGIGTLSEVYKYEDEAQKSHIGVSVMPEIKADVLYGEEVYKINDKNSVEVKAGVDLGLGYDQYKSVETSKKYKDTFEEKVEEEIGEEKGILNEVHRKFVINTDMVIIPQIKTNFEKFSIRNGVKLGLGLNSTIKVSNAKFELNEKEKYEESVLTAQSTESTVAPAAITSYVFGADYKNIVMDLELGARHIFKDGYKALPVGTIKVGYKF